MIPNRRQRRHHLAPTERELGKPVEQQNARPIAGVEPRLEDVHRDAVDVAYKA